MLSGEENERTSYRKTRRFENLINLVLSEFLFA